MEFQKIINLLDITSDNKDLQRFVTKKWIEAYNQSEKKYSINKEIRIKTPMLRLDLCDFSDAYIVVKGIITVTNPDDVNYKKNLAFKNNAPFINCILKINGVKIDNAGDLDVVMPMYNLLECSKNCRKTTGSLWNYYRDKQSSGIGGENNNVNYSIKGAKSFDYKTSITGKLESINTAKDAEIIVPLKHLSNFWRNLNIPLINCEVEIILTWSENCALTSKGSRDANPHENLVVTAINNPTNVIFKITDTKLYVPVVTLLKENEIKLLEQLKLGFKRTIKGHKYRS